MRRQILRCAMSAAAGLFLARPAAAEVSYADGGLADLGLVLGVKAGAAFGQPFGDLGTSVLAELELGYNLPLPDPVGRDLGLFFSAQYAAPGAEGRGEADARLPDGAPAEYTLTERQAVLTLGVIYRIPVPGDLIRPYAAAGGRVYLLRTEIESEAGGESFGAHEETATQLGPYGALGAELYLGPGALLLELQVGYATLDGAVFDDHNTGALGLALGYRLFL